jgi:hypothetical protein
VCSYWLYLPGALESSEGEEVNRTFTKAELKELVLPYSAIHDEIYDNSRWSILHWCVFEHEGKHWKAYYSVSATEYQDEEPWEYDDEIEATEVELREVTVKKWEPVE